MKSLQLGDLKEFSFASDKMRPMLSYIADNQITLSKHLDEDQYYQEENELRNLAKGLKANLNSVEAARKTLSQLTLTCIFLIGRTYERIFRLPVAMAWEFEHDLLVIKI